VILSRNEILKALKSGRLRIAPFLQANVGPASVDLRLGNTFRLLKPSRKPIIVSNNATYPRTFSDLISVGGSGLKLLSKQLVLGTTLERLTLSDKLVGWIQGRSRFARMGLSVHVSSSFIQPGSDNVQVLEIVNNSPSSLVLIPGTSICQVIFEETKGSAAYEGVFKQQLLP